MWRELITDLTRDIEPIYDLDPGPQFSPGATSAELEDVERQLDTWLPESLKALLSESNGVIAVWVHLIWSTDEIVECNRTMRTDPTYGERYQPFDLLLFFADAGDGSLFAFDTSEGGTAHEDIYVWNPITDERDWQVSSLRDYLEGWLTGKMSV